MRYLVLAAILGLLIGRVVNFVPHGTNSYDYFSPDVGYGYTPTMDATFDYSPEKE
jgi:hypothetical protein